MSRLPHVIFWVWLHLLQFDISNQTMDPDEDKMNKSDRPLPAKRMTLGYALIFRWLLVPVCFGLSALYSAQTFYASVALVTLTIIYDELHAHKGHWIVRNTINALGFASFETGATLVAGKHHTLEYSDYGLRSHDGCRDRPAASRRHCCVLYPLQHRDLRDHNPFAGLQGR